MADSFISPFIVPGPDGKPRFIGKDAPPLQNPPKKEEGSKMQCPICTQNFDYLVGEDTPDGGRRGCESCWRPSLGGQNAQSQELIGAKEAQETILD